MAVAHHITLTDSIDERLKKFNANNHVKIVLSQVAQEAVDIKLKEKGY